MMKSVCFTHFKDGTVHTVLIKNKIELDRFIASPYLGKTNHRFFIFQDKLNLNKYKELSLNNDG